MRDQYFQDLMRQHDQNVPSDSPNSVSESSNAFSRTGAAKPNCSSEELNSQLTFKEFLRRNLSHRKPSAQFIQSIKDRIKIIDSTTAEH